MLNRAQVLQLAHLKRKLFNGVVMYTDNIDQSFSDDMVKYIKSNIPDTIAPKTIKLLAEDLKWKMNNKKGTVKLDAVVGNDYFADFDFIKKLQAAHDNIKQHGYIALTLPVGLHDGAISIQPNLIHKIVKENNYGVSLFQINHKQGHFPISASLGKDELDFDQLLYKLSKYNDCKELYMSITLQKAHTGAFKWQE